MKLAIASDHGGFLLKEELVKKLKENGFEVVDLGCDSTESVDYPIYAKKLTKYVLNNFCYGVLICTTGIGVSMAANKEKGIRAALVTNEDQSIFSRKHNNANVICLGARYTNVNDAFKYVNNFVNTKFEGGRHERRVSQMEGLI